jgi:hypothetical protein
VEFDEVEPRELASGTLLGIVVALVAHVQVHGGRRRPGGKSHSPGPERVASLAREPAVPAVDSPVIGSFRLRKGQKG